MSTKIGWVHSIRDHKHIVFVQLWMPNAPCGGQYLQCVISRKGLGDERWREDRPKITMQACLKLTGIIVKSTKSHTGGEELQVESIVLLGVGDGDFRSELNIESETPILLHKRHMLHWAGRLDPDLPFSTFPAANTVRECMRLRDRLHGKIYETYSSLGFLKVDPPTITQIQTEGGSTLFKIDYYGQPAFLTQSSQLYLESVLPGYGNVWCLESSYRAEKSSTTRHLAEYKHLEAELIIDSLSELMAHLKLVLSKLYSSVGLDVPEFHTITHADAIQELNEIGFLDPHGQQYGAQSDLNDKAEMQLLERHNCPIFVTHFPAGIKAFYMKRKDGDSTLTDSFDLLLPGVGEVVGGSLRMTNYDELMQAFKDNGIDPAPYYWYTDLRKYGSCPHGGYGIGMERLIKAIRFAQGQPILHVRDACLYPVYYS